MADILILEAVFDVGAHHLADLGCGIAAAADAADRDIPVGDDADQTVILADRQGTGVDIRHDAGGFLDDVIGRSEEHTSELQSLMRFSYAVFCVTKKKQTIL